MLRVDADQGPYDNRPSIWTVGNLNTRASARLTITATVTIQAGVTILDNQVRVSKVDQQDNEYAQTKWLMPPSRYKAPTLTLTNTAGQCGA